MQDRNPLKNILIIEDDIGIAMLVSGELNDMGFSVVHKERFTDVFNLINESNFFIVIMDYSLPDMSGVEFLKRIKDFDIKMPPFIVTTGMGDERVAVEMMKLGARDYIIKDLSFISILPEIVKKVSKEIDNENKLSLIISEKEQSDQKFKFISENIGDGITLIENESVIYRSPSLYKMLGFNENEIDGSVQAIFNGIHKDDKDEVIRRIELGKLNKSANDIFTYRFIKNDGAIIWLEDEIRRYYDNNNKVTVVTCTRDVTERMNNNQRLLESVKEKEVLLKEIHHRVKNNLQIITSLLSLQANQITDPVSKSFFLEIQNRIRAMAMIHEHLYRSSDITIIDFGEYVKGLLPLILGNFSRKTIQLDIDIKNIFFDIDTAIPSGLIINELITNSIKYGFSDTLERKPLIFVSLHKTERKYHMLIKDNGIGLPEKILREGSNSLGLTLVNALVQQLSADIKMYNENGAVFELTFSHD